MPNARSRQCFSAQWMCHRCRLCRRCSLVSLFCCQFLPSTCVRFSAEGRRQKAEGRSWRHSLSSSRTCFSGFSAFELSDWANEKCTSDLSLPIIGAILRCGRTSRLACLQFLVFAVSFFSPASPHLRISLAAAAASRFDFSSLLMMSMTFNYSLPALINLTELARSLLAIFFFFGALRRLTCIFLRCKNEEEEEKKVAGDRGGKWGGRGKIGKRGHILLRF